MELEWDEGNIDKSFFRHGIHDWEIEEAFFDQNAISLHLGDFAGEERHTWLGRSETSGRYLQIIYTSRTRRGIRFYRPISAMEMKPRFRARYQK